MEIRLNNYFGFEVRTLKQQVKYIIIEQAKFIKKEPVVNKLLQLWLTLVFHLSSVKIDEIHIEVFD